jgi:hypothetical protein
MNLGTNGFKFQKLTSVSFTVLINVRLHGDCGNHKERSGYEQEQFHIRTNDTRSQGKCYKGLTSKLKLIGLLQGQSYIETGGFTGTNHRSRSGPRADVERAISRQQST